MKPRSDGNFEVSYSPVKFTRLTPTELQEKNTNLQSVAALARIIHKW